MRDELLSILQLAHDLPPAQLPQFLGELETIRITALSRLTSQAPALEPDTLVDAETASKRLGMSTAYLFRHADALAFARRIGRSVRFSSRGIDRYIAQRR
jgi:predicted DNA-binding transcriptional regulator AlpA